MQAASDTGDCRRLATSFDEAGVALNEGLGCMHKLSTAPATSTSAMSFGTGDRADDEQDFLRKVLDVVDQHGLKKTGKAVNL